jgi:glycoside/pentoside/hexuronide:cation symporter, GPH family
MGSEQARLTVVQKLLYGVGAISDAVKSLAFGLFLLFYYTSVRGVPATMVGAILSLSLIWDAAIDPVVGRVSDRLPAARRRHIPMLTGSLTMGVAFYCVFSPPAGLSRDALLAWLVGFNLLLRTAQSAFTVPYWALGAEATSEYDERTSLTGMRTACALAGTMVTAVLSFVLFFAGSRFEQSGYSAMGAALGAVLTMTSLVTIVGTWRWKLHDRSAEPEETSFFDEVRSAVRRRSFCVIACSSGLFFLSAVANATVVVHYLTYYAGVTDSRGTSVFQASFYVAALCGAGFWVRVTRTVEKGTAYTAATFGTALMMLLAWMLVGEGSLLGTGNLVAIAAGNAVAGFLGSAAWVLPPSMMADVLDERQAIDGRRSEGTLFGLHSLAIQLGGSIAVVLSGFLLDGYAGLVPGAQIQSAQTGQRIGAIYGLVPAVLLTGAGIVSMFYRLNRAAVLEFQKQIRAARREDEVGSAASS